MNQDSVTFGVKSLSMSIKRILESSYSKIYIKGQISQPKRMNHLYFALKEEDSVIDCICWANVRLEFEPQHDMEVICCGRISTYPGRSKYQIIILSIKHIGDSQVLEKRKLKLQKEGLFDQNKKLKLPKYPKNVGIITSPTGAVLHDMLHRLKDRYPCKVIFHPVLVQGADMVPNVIDAINYFNEALLNEIDLLIVARGGGSFEDLWGFQDENLVRTISKSKIPIISAIGHETDTTLSDYAASCRAPTPTAAIEIAFPDRKELYNKLRYFQEKISHLLEFHLNNSKQKLIIFKVKTPTEMISYISRDFKMKVMHQNYIYKQYWNQKINMLNALGKARFNISIFQDQLIYKFNELYNNYKNYINDNQNVLKEIITKMESISYTDTLQRGFCRAHHNDKLIRYKKDAPNKFSLEFQDGSIKIMKIEEI